MSQHSNVSTLNISTLQCLNTPMSQHSNVSTLQCLNTPMSQHSLVSRCIVSVSKYVELTSSASMRARVSAVEHRLSYSSRRVARNCFASSADTGLPLASWCNRYFFTSSTYSWPCSSSRWNSLWGSRTHSLQYKQGSYRKLRVKIREHSRRFFRRKYHFSRGQFPQQ